MFRRFLAVFMCAGMFLAAPAVAGDVETADPDDHQGAVDVSYIRFAGDRQMMAYTKIKLHDPVACTVFEKGSGKKLKWMLDDGMDGDVDLVGSFRCVDGKLMFFLRGKRSGNNYEAVKVNRPDQRTIKVSFPLGLQELKSKRLGVFVKSRDASSTGCDSDACTDRAPSQGSLRVY